MINFFETSLSSPISLPPPSPPKNKLIKYISAGCGVLASIGIGLKTGKVLNRYNETQLALSKLKDAADFLKSDYHDLDLKYAIKHGIVNKKVDTYRNKYWTNICKQYSVNKVGELPYKVFFAADDNFAKEELPKLYKNAEMKADSLVQKFKQVYTTDPVEAVKLMTNTPEVNALSVDDSDSLIRSGAELIKPATDTYTEYSSALERNFSLLDKFFIGFGLKLTKIPIIGKITTTLTKSFGNTKGYAISIGILGVLVIILIIGMWYLIKFLYKKWKARKLKI